jgi:hypothetical protein
MKFVSVSLAVFTGLAGFAVVAANAAECPAYIPAGVTIRLLPDENLTAGLSSGPTIFTVASDVRFFPNRPPLLARGSKVLGTIEESKQAGRLWGKARLRMTLNSILTSDLCEYPIEAKIIDASRQKVKDNVVWGRGHAKRDLVALLFPPTTVYQLLRIPSRGPKLIITNETAMTIKFMESVSLGEGTKVSANEQVGPLRARIDELEKNLSNIQKASVLPASPQPQLKIQRTPADACFRSDTIPAPALVSASTVARPIRNLTPYHVSVYLNQTPVTILPPCFGPSMIETPTGGFRLEAVASLLTAGGQKQLSLSVVPTETGWDVVVPPTDLQASTN